MECLYKDSLISLYGNETIVSFINRNSSEEIFEELYVNLFNDNERKHSKDLYAFENFYIKYYRIIKDENVKRKLENVIQSLYSCVDISNIPNISALSEASNLFKSTFTRQEYLKIFATPEQQNKILETKKAIAYYANQIASKYNMYFDKKIELIKNGLDLNTDEELKKYELTDSEKQLLINFFKISKTPNEFIESVQEKYFVDLVSEPDGRTNNIHEKEFLTFYAINNFYKTSLNEIPELSYEYNEEEKETGASAFGTDFINFNISSNLNGTNLDLVQTACHELEHIIQSRKIKKETNFNDLGYYYLIYELNRIFPQKGNSFDEEYHNNYEYMEIEIDAEKVANSKLRIYIEDSLFKKYGLSTDKLKYRIDEMNENVENRRPTFISRKKLNGNSVPTYHYNISRLEEIIGNNKDLIDKYPILKTIFDKDGKIVGEDEILKNKPINNHIVIDYISNLLYINKLENYDISTFTNEEKCNFVLNISNVFENELKKIKSIINNPNNLSKENGTISYVDDLNMINRITKIIGQNMDVIENNDLSPNVFQQLEVIMNKINEKKSEFELYFNNENAHPVYFVLLNNLSDTLNKINNSYILAKYNRNIKIRSEYINLNNLYEENDRIIQQLISNCDSEFLNYDIVDNLGNTIHISEFISNYIRNNMINGKIINLNGDELDINDIINYFYELYRNSKKMVSEGSVMNSNDSDKHL